MGIFAPAFNGWFILTEKTQLRFSGRNCIPLIIIQVDINKPAQRMVFLKIFTDLFNFRHV